MEKQERIPNLATYYVLPLVELAQNSFGENNFINCFVTSDNMIAVLVESLQQVPKEVLNNIYYFTDFPVTDDTHMIVYRVTGNYLKDIEKFKAGKYSKMSENAKSRIVIFYDFKETDTVVKVLYRDKGLKAALEEEYDIQLDDEAEVKSAPSEANFIELTNYIKEDESGIRI